MIKKVFVAISGGVDSSVAAALLKEQGYDVHGVFMQTWSPSFAPYFAKATQGEKASEGKPDSIAMLECTSREDRQMAARAAAHLGIPFAVWDFRQDYKRAVVDYMMAEYAAGRTPNPDVMCNKQIKFGVFLQRALEQGADYIATGHYARKREVTHPLAPSLTVREGEGGRVILSVAKDTNKDQTYFLWTLRQEQLTHCLFPIGDYEKSEVRAMARERGLPNWDKKDSQGLCFVGKVDFADFLRTLIPAREGVVLTRSGDRIGAHDGAQFVTVGQRHGLDLGGNANPYYVVEKNMATNTVVVAEEDDPLLYRKEIAVNNINFISGNEPELPLQCLARIRYRQPLQEARIMNYESWGNRDKNKSTNHDSRFMVQFKEPQRAVATGQSAVFYTENGEMLGGAVIA